MAKAINRIWDFQFLGIDLEILAVFKSSILNFKYFFHLFLSKIILLAPIDDSVSTFKYLNFQSVCGIL